MTKLSYTKELLDAGVIDQSTAEKINAYFANKSKQRPNLLLMIFGVLGASLIGMGILLIIGHNWDQFPKGLKTFLAFLPLLVGQGLCFYTLRKRPDSKTWRESTSIFLGLSVPACLALISQIYHLQGDLASFLFICLLLALPIVYVMNSSTTSLLYWFGTLVFAFSAYSTSYELSGLLKYILLIVLASPFAVYLFLKKSNHNATILHSWMIPFSLLAGLNLGVIHEASYAPLFFMSLLSVLYMVGYLKPMKKQEVFKSGFVVIGSVGTVIALLLFTYYDFWKSVEERVILFTNDQLLSIISISVVFLLACFLLFYHRQQKSLDTSAPIKWVFIAFAIIYGIGTMHALTATLLINFLLLAIGVFTILAGVKRDHLGILNYGLIIISALIFLRFIDANISFIIRGLLNIAVGLAFFYANYKLIKKRKAQ